MEQNIFASFKQLEEAKRYATRDPKLMIWKETFIHNHNLYWVSTAKYFASQYTRKRPPQFFSEVLVDSSSVKLHFQLEIPTKCDLDTQHLVKSIVDSMIDILVKDYGITTAFEDVVILHKYSLKKHILKIVFNDAVFLNNNYCKILVNLFSEQHLGAICNVLKSKGIHNLFNMTDIQVNIVLYYGNLIAGKTRIQWHDQHWTKTLKHGRHLRRINMILIHQINVFFYLHS